MNESVKEEKKELSLPWSGVLETQTPYHTRLQSILLIRSGHGRSPTANSTTGWLTQKKVILLRIVISVFGWIEGEVVKRNVHHRMKIDKHSQIARQIVFSDSSQEPVIVT